jgi:hypothetical protein
LSFPALKRDIVNHVKGNSSSVDPEFIALFESIDGYIEYKDTYHLRKALEQNNSEKKKTNQITGPARANPTEPSRTSSTSYVATKSESGSHKEVRTDYAKVSPSAMSYFICRNCGKQFQNQKDLIQHQEFEGIENTDKTT